MTSKFETEGRFFGSFGEMKIDQLQFNMDGGTFNSKTDTWVLDNGTRRVQWFVVRDYSDVVKVSGCEFHKMMLDISLPDRETIMYLITRLRGC